MSTGTEMLGPDGSRIRRLQDLLRDEFEAASDKAEWLLLFEREAFGTFHGIPVPDTKRKAKP